MSRFDESRHREVRSRVNGGRLVLEADGADPALLGMLAGAAAVAAETCQESGR